MVSVGIEVATHQDCMGDKYLYNGQHWFIWLHTTKTWNRIVNIEPFMKHFKLEWLPDVEVLDVNV
jgi:hypothetical protein